MRRAVLIVGLIAGFAGARAPAQEAFEVPVELELPPDAPVVLDLDGASLEIVLEREAAPLLRVRGPAEGSAPAVALAVVSDAGGVVVQRAARDGEPAAAPLPRLRLELALDPRRRLEVVGSDLDVVVEGSADLEIEPDDDDDASDGGEEADPADDAGPSGVVAAAPVGDGDPYRISLDVTGSSVNLVGVRAASLNAVRSYVHTAATRGQLTLLLEGVTAELLDHRGPLGLTEIDSEVSLNQPRGVTTLAATGGSVIARGGTGPLDGNFADALLRVEGWQGRLVIGGSRATVQALALANVRMEIRGDGHEVTVEDMRGSLLAELAGGLLSGRQLIGPVQITARGGTEVTIDGITGRPTLNLENSTARLTAVSDVVKAQISGGRLEVADARQLDLVAADAEIVAGGLERLLKAEVSGSQVDLDLWQVRNNPTLTLRGSTEARVRLRMPCSVKLGEVELLGGGVDVTGCDLHSQSFRRTRYDRRGVDGNRRVLLTALLEEGSSLEVEGDP